jgi:hypothetical protein
MGSSHAEVTAAYLGLTALSTTAAVLMLRLAPGEQWYAAATLALLMAGPAAILFLRGRRMGLLAPPILAPEPARGSATEETEGEHRVRAVHAAE